ncbi:long-chain-fatty-acid--CoA ligase [Bacillus solimangrovi]|uniref:Long-chain fatty acid--CoA ligase n=1 Tax=Bacillus solimangrovi TaxID=1305675 RepID=A0A1E5LCS7_9BACI|nr:long-chain-fatty-acid--CoA ligase [Bacillus solimangrovi]OEH91892.1 long-chain fatty acid--CoA ligase [Bacillus solimangrovi]
MEQLLERPWASHYPTEIPQKIDYGNKAIHHYLLETAKNHPEKKALYFYGTEMTYKELLRQVKKLANYLQDLGVEKGDRVAIMLANCPQGVISYYAALMAGGIVVQVNPMYTEREMQYQLKDSGSKFLICLDLFYPKAVKVKSNTEVEQIIVTGIKDYLPFPKNLLYPFVQRKKTNMIVKVKESECVHLFKNAIKKGRDTLIEHDFEPAEDIALLQYTGGTTGFPKGVMLTHKNIIANSIMCRYWLYKCREGEESLLAVLPFFHVFGLTTVMNLSVLIGAKMIILPKFDPEEVMETIQKQRSTIFPGTPTMYIALLNHPNLKKYDLSSIESCVSGSAPLPVEVQEKFERETDGKVVEGFGLTEASPVTHANLVWGNRVKGSVGIPWPDTDSYVLSAEKQGPADIGEIGEIVVRGPQVMKGYWNRPEETAATFMDGDWLLTGDLGYMDENGYFYIVDRKKDMIIAGGFNIYPREIEEVLYEHPAIQEAVAVGVPDEYRGETVKVYIVLKEGTQLTEEELEAFCRENLAAYKVPRLYEFRKELPKTAVGKILRRTLAEEAKQKTS